MINLIVTYFVGQHHSSHYHRQLVLLLVNNIWDAPFVESSFATLLASQPDEYNRARLLAAAAPHSGDWLHVLPISSCGLRLDDDAIRVAIGLRLGANLCDPHVCPCGTFVNSRGIHSLSCKRGSSNLTRHVIINNLVHRAFVRARIPSTMEPTGLSRSNGKRPDGLTLVPWSAGKSIIWDVTVVDTLAASHIQTTSKTAGGAAEITVARKEEKYSVLLINYDLIVIALEILGPLSNKTYNFLRELGRRLTIATEDLRETSFLSQRISVAVQRFNAIRICDSFPVQVTLTRIFLLGIFYLCFCSFRNINSLIIVTIVTTYFFIFKSLLLMIFSYVLS